MTYKNAAPPPDTDGLARWQRGNAQYTRWAVAAHDKELEDIEQRYSDLRRQRERKNQPTPRK